MQIVYVLVSDNNDSYLEQCLISVTSLKKRMPNCQGVLLSDNNTISTLTNEREKIKECFSSIVEIEFPNIIKKKERSRYLKTSMRRFIKGDFLFIDCDTIVCEDLGEIEKQGILLGAVMDNHLPLSKNVYAHDMEKRVKVCDFHTSYMDIHYNSGVLWISDSKICHDFFSLWHDLWKEGKEKGILSDQLSFNEANYRMGGAISELHGTWNCQINFGIRFINEAKIIHYLGFNPRDEKARGVSLPYKLASNELYAEIKEKKRLSDEVIRIIDNPKGEDAFFTSFLINRDRAEVEIIHGAAISCLRIPYRKIHWLYLCMDYLVRVMQDFWRYLILRKEI